MIFSFPSAIEPKLLKVSAKKPDLPVMSLGLYYILSLTSNLFFVPIIEDPKAFLDLYMLLDSHKRYKSLAFTCPSFLLHQDRDKLDLLAMMALSYLIFLLMIYHTSILARDGSTTSIQGNENSADRTGSPKCELISDICILPQTLVFLMTDCLIPFKHKN